MNELNYEKVFNTLVEETSNYITNNHLKCMVLGISGGIDSTVVAAICHDVSRKTNVPLIGRSLPIKNKDDEFDVSKLIGEAFCNDFKVVSLLTLYIAAHNNLLFEEVEADDDYWVKNKQTPIANGNIQARLRMIYLYNLASIHKGLVMSTDNQTEYQLGFWTIHGDVGDFNPLQDLWKTEVYGLAKWLADHYIQNVTELREDVGGISHKQAYAIQQSIALTPTDGLGISNSDLEQIGAKSYDEVDDILESLLEFYPCECDGDRVAFNIMAESLVQKYGEDIVTNVWKRHLASKFKRRKAPIFIYRGKYE